VAQGDLMGVGGAGGFATNVGFSGAPFNMRPFPDASTPGLIEGEAVALEVPAVGAGDLVFGGTSGCLAGAAEIGVGRAEGTPEGTGGAVAIGATIGAAAAIAAGTGCGLAALSSTWGRVT
jgi:hypothetical protein